MAFEILTDKLTAAIQKLRGQKTVSEQDLKETLREVRLAAHGRKTFCVLSGMWKPPKIRRTDIDLKI